MSWKSPLLSWKSDELAQGGYPERDGNHERDTAGAGQHLSFLILTCSILANCTWTAMLNYTYDICKMIST